MKATTTILVVLFLALIYFTDGKDNPPPEVETTKPKPKHIVGEITTTPKQAKKPENTAMVITGNVTYSFSDEAGTTFREDPNWKKVTNQN